MPKKDWRIIRGWSDDAKNLFAHWLGDLVDDGLDRQFNPQREFARVRAYVTSVESNP